MHWRTANSQFCPSATLARWVLGAWLCVLLVSVLTPFARAMPPAGWEAVCSADGATHWVPSPASEEAQVASHGLDCALCLPAMAPPPAQQSGLGACATIFEARQWVDSAPRVFASTLPPVRAPPQ